MAISLVLAGLSLLLSRLLTGNYRKAGVAASVSLVLFFSYGHVYLYLRGIWPARNVAIGLVLLFVCGVFLAGAVLLLRRTRKELGGLTSIFNIVAACLVFVSVVRIGAYELSAGGEVSATEVLGHWEPGEDVSSAPEVLPDIYYIVMDRYPSLSTLRDVYDFDNSEFLDYLTSKGFYVATESRCNYARTDMSLASSLNMEYINDLVDSAGRKLYRRALHARTQDYRVWRFLRSKGYRFIHFGTWWRSTSYNRYADENVNRLLLGEFSMMLYKTTMARLIGSALGFDAMKEQWGRVLHKFDRLAETPAVREPVFAFVHFLVPHEPYVLDSTGGFVASSEQMARGTKVGFVNQLVFANRNLKMLIDKLLSDSGALPVVILQADEGPHPPENFDSIDEVNDLRARFRILNAYYLPRVDSSALYPSITPVNSFRVVLNRYFGADLELLPDRSYTYVNGRFVDVADRVRYATGN